MEGKMKKTKKSKKNDQLTVLGLLGAISYWGVTARVLLASVFIWFAYILNISHIGTAEWRAFDTETIFLIFGLSTLLVADLGYTVAARALPIHKNTDRSTFHQFHFSLPPRVRNFFKASLAC